MCRKQKRFIKPQKIDEIFSLQKKINKKLFHIYNEVVSKYISNYGRNRHVEQDYQPTEYQDDLKDTWEMVFSEHYKHHKLQFNISWIWKIGFQTENGSLEEVFFMQKELNKLCDEFKMEVLLEFNNEEIKIMHYAGYNYRTIIMDNQKLMREILFCQMQLNDELKFFLINLKSEIFDDMTSELVEEIYSHKHINDYGLITWEDIFKQHKAKQILLVKHIGLRWKWRYITVEETKLENILKLQERLINALDIIYCDLEIIYKDMYNVQLYTSQNGEPTSTPNRN